MLSILNVALRRYLPRAALRPAEFAVIYGISTVAAGIAAQDEVMQLFPMFVYPFRATQATAMGPFRAYIPGWLVPQDPAIVEPYYIGGETFLDRTTAPGLGYATVQLDGLAQRVGRNDVGMERHFAPPLDGP